jgi:hypothetical protein
MLGFELMRTDESIFRNSYSMLTITQLEHACDSLQRELDLKSSRFYYSMLENNFFKINSADAGVAVTNRMPAYRNVPDFPSTAYNPTLANRPVRKRSRPLPVDSVSAAKTMLKVHNFDSLFNSFPEARKHEFVKSALNYTSLNQFGIINIASNIKFETKYLRRHQVEWHRKFTLSLACLIFLFIGAPLGAIIRKGGLGMPTVISTLLFILYYIISLTGEKFVRESVLTGFQGMWMSSFILVVAGIFLTYEATNDSAILNLDSYLNWIRERLGLRKGILLDKKAHLTGKFDLIEIPRIELQQNFSAIAKQARACLEKMKSDSSLFSLAGKAVHKTPYMHLIEFEIHYNSLIDLIILSKWFRNPYFKKRISEFPIINGRIVGRYFPNKFLKIASFVFFPIWILIIIHLWIRVNRLRRGLQQVNELCTGMVNLLNSSAIKIDVETENEYTPAL